MNMRTGMIGCTAGLLFLAGGCVERTLSIDSNPPGALVFLNDQEIGRTPLQHDFLWHAKYDVTLRKDGYITCNSTADVKTPIYEWIPLDLVSELLPIPFKDRHHYSYDLTPEAEVTDTPALIDRGQALQGQLQAPHFPPATKPTTKK